MFDRQELIEEIKLRDYIRRAIRVRYHKLSESKRQEEFELRKIVRRLLEADTEKTQHRSTGINVLEDLLKKIIPVIEQDYKMLTTDAKQRQSFSAHIVAAINNTLSPARAMKLAEIKIIEDIEVEIGEDEIDSEELDTDAFIDIDSSGGEGGLEDLGDEDKTGLNFAQSTFDKIEKQISDAYDLLGNEEDQDLFFRYLITNVKLYFDKFEEELKSSIEEPTTPEYEEEKEKSTDDLDSGEESEEEELEI